MFDKYLNTCIKEINNLGNPKQFNKKDGLNCLEHLIKDLNFEKISDDIANKTVQKILEYQLLITLVTSYTIMIFIICIIRIL